LSVEARDTGHAGNGPVITGHAGGASGASALAASAGDASICADAVDASAGAPEADTGHCGGGDTGAVAVVAEAGVRRAELTASGTVSGSLPLDAGAERSAAGAGAPAPAAGDIGRTGVRLPAPGGRGLAPGAVASAGEGEDAGDTGRATGGRTLAAGVDTGEIGSPAGGRTAGTGDVGLAGGVRRPPAVRRPVGAGTSEAGRGPGTGAVGSAAGAVTLAAAGFGGASGD